MVDHQMRDSTRAIRMAWQVPRERGLSEQEIAPVVQHPVLSRERFRPSTLGSFCRIDDRTLRKDAALTADIRNRLGRSKPDPDGGGFRRPSILVGSDTDASPSGFGQSILSTMQNRTPPPRARIQGAAASQSPRRVFKPDGSGEGELRRLKNGARALRRLMPPAKKTWTLEQR